MADLMQQARELLPCPFCGEAAKHTVWGDAGYNKVECTYCDVCMDYFYHQDDAFEAWNRRAALRAAPECPEGFVLVPVNPSEEWVRSVIRTWQPVLPEGCKGWRKLEDELLHWHAAMLAARPQGVKDV